MNNQFVFRVAIACIIAILCVSHSWAADNSPQVPDSHPAKGLPMHSVLYDLNHAVAVRGTKASGEIARLGLTTRADGMVNVEIINQIGSTHLDTTIVGLFEGEVDAVWRRRVSAWVPPNQMINLAGALPPGYYMERASVLRPDDEGPGRIGSDDYRDNGANGTGINIAIIDGGFGTLPASQTAGVAPATYGGIDYVGTGITSGTIHGTGCVETAFDHAPGANYFLYRISNLTHLGNAVDDAVANNVDIISHSRSAYNTGWHDNSGDACAAVTTATDNGILFFTSAGNRAQQHWQGDFDDGINTDSWHEWGPGGDASIDISMPAQASGTFDLCWDTDGGTYDYDLYLYNQSGTTILASSVNGGNNFENFSWANPSATTAQTVRLYVLKYSGGITEMEIFNSGSGNWLEYSVASSSTTSPSNSREINLISVGAVDQVDYDSASGVNNINKNYSSQGPTNTGYTGPKCTAPTNTTTIAYGGAFGGTSASTPNAAGAAAAFWSSAPNLSASGVRYLLLEQAHIFKDWGAAGFDNIYVVAVSFSIHGMRIRPG